MELFNFIGGEFIASESKKTFVKYSPFDNTELAQVASSDAMDVIKSLQLSKKALASFETSTVEQRAELLNKIADYFEQNAQQISYQEALHQGLPQKFVLKNSVQVAIKNLRNTAVDVVKPLPEGTVARASGIVGVITSWCLSLRLVTERLSAALAAGNAVMIKVSEQSPITAQIIGDACKFAGVPVGLVQILHGGSDIAQLIAGHPGIRAITAVGQPSTMEAIAKAALPQLKKLQLSGGAKNSAIVLADFDFKNHMDEIMAPFLIGQGQMCWNMTRLFVLESFAKEFQEELKNYVANLKPLTSPEGDSMWTPMISPERASVLDGKVQFGVSEHGKVLGQSNVESAGNFAKPTFMIDLPNCSEMQQDELRAPLFLITSVKYQHETVKWANTSYLGHSAIVWGPVEKVMKVADKLESAQVWINTWLQGEDQTTFGLKQSSFGISDMAWSGSFYSDVRKLTVLP